MANFKLTAKEYLKTIKILDSQIMMKNQEIKDIKNEMMGCKAISYDPKVGTGSANTLSPQEKYYPILEQYQEELQQQINELVQRKRTILKIFDGMSEPLYTSILYFRYFKYKKWEEIAVELKYSYQGVLKAHGKALLDFERVYKSIH